MAGGRGYDIYEVDNVGDKVIEEAGEGNDLIRSRLQTYSLTNNPHVEDLSFVGSGNFVGFGNDLDNVITGWFGSDRLIGGAGNDTLDGRFGADTMAGGTGDDTFLVDNVLDTVIELTGEGFDHVKSYLNAYSLLDAPNVEALSYIGLGNFIGTGNALDNHIIGGSGRDTLDGGSGADTMEGGRGDDTYWVDDPGDIVIEKPGEGRDRIITSLHTFSLLDAPNVEILSFVGTGAVTVIGNDVGNDIVGGAGPNDLKGGKGDDRLSGQNAGDNLSGGPGNDQLRGVGGMTS
jgi:Ca2+-binding RTX toxin-like protein